MQGEHFCLKYRTEELKSICGVPGFDLVPPFRQSRADFIFDFAAVGINVRPDYGESVHRCRIQVLHALELKLGTCAGCGNSQKSTGLSRFRSAHMSLKFFPRFTSYNQAASLTFMSRGSSLERISAEWRETVRCLSDSVERGEGALTLGDEKMRALVRAGRWRRWRSARLASASSTEVDCPENKDHVVRECLHVYVEVPEFLE
ncbi:hypothetical protein EVAR_52197_1 [Eumeta japonica]|uniref:Uncharacterized protein n=1 Tax=Eumeta variegata TaxID=151549 RepID=A0A4C1Z143_EUMVA|nr:hypothetical protein EVAR_52197_1 [Eumeta japonica]